MAKVYHDKDANLDVLKNKKIAIIGYGIQGRGQALNLRDSGVGDVVIGLRPGSASAPKAEGAGLKVMAPADAAKWADGISGMSTNASGAEAKAAFDLAERCWREAGRRERPILNTATWFAVGAGAAPREQVRAHLHRYFNWMPDAREAMASRFGFAGTARELCDLLRSMEDAGADELQLIPTTIDPDEDDCVAEIISASGI